MFKYYSPAVYGPIASRRLGWSLGINLLPVTRKVCSFDCIYCECGTAKNSVRAIPNGGFLSLAEFEQELARCFSRHADHRTQIDYITFAGNGEPTLYPWFDLAVEATIRMRDHYLPNIPIAIFTNATTVGEKRIVDSLYKLDRRFVKLDAGDEDTYNALDRPLIRCSLEKIVATLAGLTDMEVSTAVVDGVVSNVNSIRSDNYLNIIKESKARGVYVYAIDRPSAYPGLVTVSESILDSIGTFLKSRLTIPVTILKSKKHRPSWFDESYADSTSIPPPKVYPV